MSTPPSPSLPSADIDHRGWKLQTALFRASLGASEGWVCFATRPDSSHKLNLGRWPSSDLALEHGRAYVDRRVDRPGQPGATLPLQKRRQ